MSKPGEKTSIVLALSLLLLDCIFAYYICGWKGLGVVGFMIGTSFIASWSKDD